MVEQIWSDLTDAEARRQLGVPSEYSVFMMAISIDYVDDMDGAIDRLSGDGGMLHPEEVKDALAEWTCEIRLPKGWALVGMSPVGKREPVIYGIVDLAKMSPAQSGAEPAMNAAAEDYTPHAPELEDGRDDGRCTRFYPSLEGSDWEGSGSFEVQSHGG